MAEKQGEVRKITQKDTPEFKGDGGEVKKGVNPPPTPSPEGIKKTSVITMQNSRPTRIYFEDGRQVKAEPIS